MKGRKLRKIFLSVISAVTVLTGALGGMIPTNASLSFGASKEEHALTTADLLQDYYHIKTDIRIATWFPESDLTNLKAYLAKEFPRVNFTFEYIAKSNYEQIIDAKLSIKGAPDILYMDQEMVQKHAVTGYIANVTDITAKFNKEAKQAFGYGNAVYAVPNTSEFECIFYNKELFDQKGVKVPNSFSTLIGCCDYLKVVRKITPLAASLKDPYNFSNTAFGALSADYLYTDRGRGFGGRLQYGRTTFTEELLPYMGCWEELVSHDIFTPDMYTIDELTAIERFCNCEAAMIVGGPETYKSIMEINPDMKLGTIPYFSTDGAVGAIIGGCDLGFALNKNSENFNKAKQVMASLARFEGQVALFYDRPGSQTYLEDTHFEMDKVFEGIEQCYEDGMVFTPWMDWGMELNRPIHYKFGRELQKVILKRETLDEAFANVDALVYEILHEGQ
jgi:multiple sugar transport system substrate-binding protein